MREVTFTGIFGLTGSSITFFDFPLFSFLLADFFAADPIYSSYSSLNIYKLFA
jgi:hypothetical protein